MAFLFAFRCAGMVALFFPHEKNLIASSERLAVVFIVEMLVFIRSILFISVSLSLAVRFKCAYHLHYAHSTKYIAHIIMIVLKHRAWYNKHIMFRHAIQFMHLICSIFFLHTICTDREN